MVLIVFFINILAQISLQNTLGFATATVDVAAMKSTVWRGSKHVASNIKSTSGREKPLFHATPSLRHTYRLRTSSDKSFKIPTELRSFWRGGKTAKQIRSRQRDIMKQYMDTSVEPCDDFYQYACGNWAKRNPPPKFQSSYDTYDIVQEILDIELNNLLSEKDEDCLDADGEAQTSFKLLDARDSVEDIKASAGSTKKKNVQRRSVNRTEDSYRCGKLSSAEQKAKYLYQSCMNAGVIQKRGATPLLELISYLGGWPVLEGRNWRERMFDWIQVAGILRLYNSNIFIMQWVGPDVENTEENIIQFDEPSLGLLERYDSMESDADYLEKYQNYMNQIMILLGASEKESEKASSKIVQFEVKLALLTATIEERVNTFERYHRMTIEELHKRAPRMDWHRYLEIVLEQPLERTEVILTFAMKFMQDLAVLLAETDTRTIANYMFWKFVYDHIGKLNDRYLVPQQEFYELMYFLEEASPRWKMCVNQVNTHMGLVTGAMFIRRYFDEESKRDTMAMTNELKDAFRDTLHEIDWIDSSTKSLVEMKLNEMSAKIGYWDLILDTQELDYLYEDVEINPEQYFENMLNVLLDIQRSNLGQFHLACDRTFWSVVPAIVNAHYARFTNDIMLPAGILQPPFYHRHFPRSLNFGGIGEIIGHELTHGFDNQGRFYDENGNYNRRWSNRSIKSFDNTANCLISQYANYSMFDGGGLPIDGIITLNENIADNGGLNQAFRAYEKWLREYCQTPECLKKERLPGWSATNKQLFFLHFAQLGCEASNSEGAEVKMKATNYSPQRFRIIGTLSNSKEFAREFGCAPGTPMNPVEKCTVW